MPVLPPNMLCLVRPMMATEIMTQKLLSQQLEEVNEGGVTVSRHLETPLSAETSSPAHVSVEIPNRQKKNTAKATKAISLSNSKTSHEERNATQAGTKLRLKYEKRWKKFANAFDIALPDHSDNAQKPRENAANSSNSTPQLSSSDKSNSSSRPISCSPPSSDNDRELLRAPIIDFLYDDDDIIKFCA